MRGAFQEGAKRFPHKGCKTRAATREKSLAAAVERHKGEKTQGSHAVWLHLE